jgi:predicted nucleic acid-binding protein
VAWFYLDTSTVVKRYAMEWGTRWITALADPVQGHNLWTVRLSAAELVAALYRKARLGEIFPADAAAAVSAFRAHWQQQYQIVEASAAVVDVAMLLAERHGLRGYDAVQLSAALTVEGEGRAAGVPGIVFLSADDQQLRVARAEGLAVDNPNDHH